MHTFFKNIAITILISSASLYTYALPIVNADAFILGDNRAIKDTLTGLTWLDFGVNNYKSYDQVVSELDSVYAGWRLPNENEVNQLWTHLFSSLPEWNSNVEGVGFGGVYAVDHPGETEVKNLLYEIFNIFGVNEFSDLVDGQPYDRNTFKIINLGMFQKSDGFVIPAGIYYTQIGNHQGLYAELMNSLEDPWINDSIRDEIYAYTSTLLIKKSSVPESSSFMLFILGLSGLCIFRRRCLKKTMFAANHK